jgi:hypothetical protein
VGGSAHVVVVGQGERAEDKQHTNVFFRSP